ncbi:MAG TPA: PAS domain-containing protein [Rhodospirillaceae bacterium]|nr:PAS domain-containing protein [Rhodospirillaceae bacterium]
MRIVLLCQDQTDAADLPAGAVRLGDADSLFQGILFIEPAGTITFANSSAKRLLADGAGLVGRPVEEVFRTQRNGAAVVFGTTPFAEDDAVFDLADGRRLPVGYACSPVVEDGRHKGVILSFRDIGKLKEAQADALQSSKLASVGQLAAGIAHEINTPIQYIGDNIRFLSGAFDEILPLIEQLRGSPAIDQAELAYLLGEIPRAIAQSLEGVGQVARIVLAMKDFSHPGEKEKTAVDLNRSIENTVAVSRNEWKLAAEIGLDLDAALPLVTCLPGEMNQVFLNLLINAVHAIEAKGPASLGHITISTRRAGEMVEIIVADDGIGMPETVKRRIFDPFFTTKGIGKGTGQGLAICRDVVVAKHGGRIQVDSEEGKGSRFTLSLPLEPE